MLACRSVALNLYNKINFTAYIRSLNLPANDSALKSVYLPTLSTWRSSHAFLSRLKAEQLWKGVTSVSSAGRKKGRGRGAGRKLARDLNRGQVIGFGKTNMLWPGLNAPVIQGREVVRQQELPPDENREKRLFELRDKMASKKFNKIHPLERGWSGTKLHGRSLGPPEPVGEETFEGFDSRVLQFKPVMHMTGDRGRVRRMSAIVVVGNKKGLAGFGVAKSVNPMSAAKTARNRAAKLLRYIELDGSTVRHDFYCEFGAVKVFVEKRPEGFGLTAHRLIRAICEVLGIKDLYAKVEGPTDNYLNLTRAFFIGLMTQKSLQQIAEEKGLHIVRMSEDQDNFPVVVASPTKCRTEAEIGENEQVDFHLHLHGGRVVEPRKKYQPFYINFPTFIKEMEIRQFQRNQKGVVIDLLAKYGAITSHLQLKEGKKK
ncbi:hypothetical protein JTE90_023198 [Oedothorax gibbosus]|uniref:Small ribosomal subunit protein uS5m n=1 Tax=Oedothorax gibbosus TaxID=931172 RepID=A0AAV6VKK1_9ARAC|nr:hypothetical protein JTE90_023198 [Oedothorax gibbosus]